MKIGYIIHHLKQSGAETIVTNYLLELKRQGHEVFLIVFWYKDSPLTQRLQQANIKIMWLFPGVSESFLSRLFNLLVNKVNPYLHFLEKKLAKIIDVERPDIIHWHTNISYNKCLKFPANRMVHTIHCDFNRFMEMFPKEIPNEDFLVDNGMQLIVLNNKMKKDAEEHYKGKTIHTLPNGLELQNIRNNTYNRKEFLKKNNLPEDSFILIMVGRFVKVKNHKWAIKIFSNIIKKKDNAFFLIVGKEEEDIKQEIVNEIAINNIPSEKVRFLGMRNDATSILSISDACILPSHSEAFPLVAVESQALGVRTIVSDNIPEEVVCNKNAFRLSLDESEDKWADTILGSFERDTDKTIDEYNVENVVKRHLHLYDNCIKTSK